MTRIKLNHEFSDSDHIKQCEVASMNNDGNLDYVSLKLKFGYQHFNLEMTKADIIMMAKGLNVTAEDLK
jgi:hypothetical protein